MANQGESHELMQENSGKMGETGNVVGGATTPPDQSPDKEVDLATPKRTTAPAFQFYCKDFLSSTKVQRMSLTEVGAYIILLSHCWLDNGLPTDVNQLARIVKVPEKQFARMWRGALSECFYESRGRLQNQRLDEERRKQAEFRRRQSDNAVSRWDKKRQSHGNATALPRQSQTDALLSPISDLQSAIKKERESSEPFNADLPAEDGHDGQSWFLQLIAAYPSERVTHNRDTELAFVHELGPLPEWRERFDLMLATLEQHKASEQWKTPRFIPNLMTWLKRGDWRGTRKLSLAATGTEGRGRTGVTKGKFVGIEEQD